MTRSSKKLRVRRIRISYIGMPCWGIIAPDGAAVAFEFFETLTNALNDPTYLAGLFLRPIRPAVYRITKWGE